MSKDEVKCVFCKTASKKVPIQGHRDSISIDCAICGEYAISRPLSRELGYRDFDLDLLNCVAENIKHNPHIGVGGLTTHWVSDKGPKVEGISFQGVQNKVFETFSNRQTQHSTKPFELMEVAASKLERSMPFEGFEWSLKDLYRCKIIDFKEGYHWIESLIQRNWIAPFPEYPSIRKGLPQHNDYANFFSGPFSLTPGGWSYLEDNRLSSLNKKIFIAMDFGRYDRAEAEQAITEACRSAGGWSALPVDKDQHNNYIPDQIYGNIRKARFVICDLTSNNLGVYLEGGFSLGLEKPTIFLIKDDKVEIENIHFDLKQMNQIRYADWADLKVKLSARIEAMFPTVP